jgi:pantoate--beta-alanine ligase
MEMISLVHTPGEFRNACAEARRDGPLALVPTMGYLHEGHAALIRAAAQRAKSVAVSIFVNPAQFGPGEDLSRYPRDLDRDLKICATSGASFVFAPRTPVELYPPGFQTWVEPGPLAQPLCGARRPGHFRGVCTVVAKLFALSRADLAVFGEKDYQQLLVVRRMARDLDLGTEVVGHPIVRERDGLALSSRNAYLSPEEREKAVALWRALGEVRARFARGERDVAALEQLAKRTLTEAGLRVDYAELRDPYDLERPAVAAPTTRLFLAAFVGKTRLIDNGAIGDPHRIE